MLHEGTLTNSPFDLFDQWMQDATAQAAITEPTAMALATANAQGHVSCRIVLLKAYDEAGFVFYTNHATGRKSLDIQSNPYASLCFYWMPLDRQVRIEGRVEKVADAEADAYFASRKRGSQIGAWASIQSTKLDSRETLEARIAELEKEYDGKTIPRPPHWSGWRVIPSAIEFWEQKDFRLHDRFVYTRNDSGDWEPKRLNP